MFRLKILGIGLLGVVVCHYAFAEITFLSCEVQGYAMNSGMGKVDFPKAKVTVTIEKFDKDKIFIKVEGHDPYVGFATSLEGQNFKNINRSTTEKYHLITTSKNSENEININRFSGLLSVNNRELTGDMPTSISFSGSCEKENKRKF